eukprot:gene15612-biopygen37164
MSDIQSCSAAYQSSRAWINVDERCDAVAALRLFKGTRVALRRVVYDVREDVVSGASPGRQCQYLPLVVFVEVLERPGGGEHWQLPGLQAGIVPIVPMQQQWSTGPDVTGTKVQRTQLPLVPTFAFTYHHVQGWHGSPPVSCGLHPAGPLPGFAPVRWADVAVRRVTVQRRTSRAAMHAACTRRVPLPSTFGWMSPMCTGSYHRRGYSGSVMRAAPDGGGGYSAPASRAGRCPRAARSAAPPRCARSGARALRVERGGLRAPAARVWSGQLRRP